jgi:hypothetical protein
MSRVDQRPALRGDVALGFRSHDPQKWELFLRQDHASIARMSLTRSAAAGSSMIAPVALKDRAKSLNGPLMAATLSREARAAGRLHDELLIAPRISEVFYVISQSSQRDIVHWK